MRGQKNSNNSKILTLLGLMASLLVLSGIICPAEIMIQTDKTKLIWWEGELDTIGWEYNETKTDSTPITEKVYEESTENGGSSPFKFVNEQLALSAVYTDPDGKEYDHQIGRLDGSKILIDRDDIPFWKVNLATGDLNINGLQDTMMKYWGNYDENGDPIDTDTWQAYMWFTHLIGNHVGGGVYALIPGVSARDLDASIHGEAMAAIAKEYIVDTLNEDQDFVRSTVGHETGHMFNFGHCGDGSCMMYPTITSQEEYSNSCSDEYAHDNHFDLLADSTGYRP